MYIYYERLIMIGSLRFPLHVKLKYITTKDLIPEKLRK